MKRNLFILMSILGNFIFSQNDGDLDLSFGGYFSPYVSDRDDTLKDFLIDEQNYIVSIGQTFYQSELDFASCSVTSTGDYNLSFGNNGIYHDSNINKGNPYKIEKLTDGYLAVGTYRAPSSLTTAFAIVKYTENGILDNTFANNGILIDNMFSDSDIAISAKVLNNGKILIAGNNILGSVCLLMIDINGNIDTSFGTNGRKLLNFPNNTRKYSMSQLELIGNDKFIIIGNSSVNNLSINEYDLFVAQLDYNGSFDTNFGNNGLSILDIQNSNEYNAKLGLYNNGNYILVGSKSDENNNSSLSETLIAKFDSNGNIITNFGNSGIITLSIINYSDSLNEYTKSCIVDDNYIYIAGYYNITFSSTSYKGFLCKLDIDGNLVSGFADNGVLSFGNTMNIAEKVVFDNTNLVVGGTDTFSDDDFIFVRIINSTTLEIDSFNHNNLINYYPNPVKEKITIKLNETLGFSNLTEVSILNIDGSLIVKKNVNYTNGLYELKLDDLSKGIYIIKISESNKNYFTKIIKD